jgi:hypothetical protein
MSSESSTLKLSISDSPPAYTPSVSEFGMMEQSASPVSMVEKAKSLSTAFCRMSYKFATYPSQEKFSYFTLKQSPGNWWKHDNYKKGVLGIRDSDDCRDSAAKLLLVIMMGSIHISFSKTAKNMDPSARKEFYQRVFKESVHEEKNLEGMYAASVRMREEFYEGVFRESLRQLFHFEGAPEQYLCLVQNIRVGNEGCLKGFVDRGGQAFFKVTLESGLVWLTKGEGMKFYGHNIAGELPLLPLELL